MSDSEIQEKEQQATLDNIESDFSPDEQEQFSALGDNDPKPESDQVGKGFTGKNSQKPKFWTRRKKTSGGIVGAIITLLVGGSTLFGPGLTVNHLRSLLLEKIGLVQIDHTRRYRRSRLSKVSDMFSTDGRRGGKIITEMQTRGYRPIFSDPTDKKKITGLITPNDDYIIGDGVSDHIDKYLEVHHPLRTSRWKTKRMEAFYTRYKVSRKAVTTKTLTKIDDPEVEVNKGVTEQIDGEELDTTTTSTKIDGETDEERIARSADNDWVAKNDGSLEDIKGKLREGVSVSDLSDDERKLLQIAYRVDDEVIDLMNKIATGSAASVALGSFKSLASSTDILDKICTSKNRLKAISFAARNYRALSLLRYASVFIKAGDDVRRGTVSPKLLNELMKRTTAKDSNGNSIGGSPGFAYILKNKFSRSKNNISKSNVSVNGTLTGIPGAIQGATDQIPAVSKAQCGVYQNVGFQIGVAAVEIGLAIFTGGGTKAATVAGREGVELALRAALKSIISKQTAKSLIKSVATTIAIEITFEGALTLLQFYSEKASTLNFTGQEKGGELGDILTAGAGTMNKQRGLQSGMVPATSAQYASANAQYFAEKKEAQKTQSFYTRIFDYDNQDSVAYNAASRLATMPYGIEGAGAAITNSVNMASGILSKPFSIFSNLGSIFSGKAFAQTTDEIPFEEYDAKGTLLATDPAGNLLPVMRDDILAIDPEENETFLTNSGDIDPTTYQPVKDGRFEKHIENCVDGVDTISIIENEDQSDPKFDCLATQSITVRFKAYLAWLDMQDGLDAYLFPEEIASANTTFNLRSLTS